MHERKRVKRSKGNEISNRTVVEWAPIVIGLLLLATLVAFTGVIAFTNDDSTTNRVNITNIVNTTLDEEIITSESNITIPVDSNNICDPFEVTTWRLHRVGKQVTFGFQGFCHDVDGSALFLNLDLSMANLPAKYQTPSPNMQRADISGTGSALVQGSNITTVVEVDGDMSDTSVIDIDIRFGDSFNIGDTIEMSMLCLFMADL